MSTKLHVKKGDTVCLMTGKYSDKYADDKGTRKTGKDFGGQPEGRPKSSLEGINVVSKHVKPRRMGETGGIVKAEAPIYACKVQVYCPKCKKPVRTGIKVDGDKKVRVCKKCGEEIK